MSRPGRVDRRALDDASWFVPRTQPLHVDAAAAKRAARPASFEASGSRMNSALALEQSRSSAVFVPDVAKPPSRRIAQTTIFDSARISPVRCFAG